MREEEFEELEKKSQQVKNSSEPEEYKKGFTRISNNVLDANDGEADEIED